jgi:hypothetical protein
VYLLEAEKPSAFFWRGQFYGEVRIALMYCAFTVITFACCYHAAYHHLAV